MRLGEGPDAGDLTRMRFGLRDRPIAASRDDNPFPAPPSLGGIDRDTAIGGGTVTTGPLRMMGNTDGPMRFGFATSLRDVARYSAEAEASKTDEPGLGYVGRSASWGAARFNPFDIWIEGKYASFSDNRASNDLGGHFGLVSIGADYVLNRSLLVGTMVQFDSMRQSSTSLATDVSGQGWMIGPYATLRLSEHMFWQARAALGRSSNEVSPFLTYTDKFETDRWLVSSTLTGRWGFGPWMFKPSVSVAYMEDVAKSYTDTFGAGHPRGEIATWTGQGGPRDRLSLPAESRRADRAPCGAASDLELCQ